MEPLLEFAKVFGFPLALVAFFIWRDYGRESMMSARIASSEMYIRDTLLKICNDSTNAINNSTRATEQVKAVLDYCKEKNAIPKINNHD